MPSSLDLNIENAIKYLNVSPGIWIRGTQYPDVKDMSRDQLDPMICALGTFTNYRNTLWQTFVAHIKRGFFYQNGDAPMLTTPSLYIRAFKAWWAYPFLLIFDLAFLWCFVENLQNVDPNSVDDNNAIVRFLQAAFIFPTPWSSIGRWAYTKTRPVNNGCKALGGTETNTVMGALVWYHRAASGGNPEIAEAYRSYIMKWFAQ